MGRSKLNSFLEERIHDQTEKMLQALVQEKVREAGGEISLELTAELLAHVRQNPDVPFVWDDGTLEEIVRNIDIKFTGDDLILMKGKINEFAESELAPALDSAMDTAAKGVLKRFKADWPSVQVQEDAFMSQFIGNLELRWGEGFKRLRMLRAACLQIGEEKNRKFAKSRSKKDRTLRATLLRLHARSLQVCGEIVLLLCNGFADGAFARWRTLHEIAVVATVLAEHGDDLAIRYVRHQAVEDWNGMIEYDRCAPLLGYVPISKSERASIEKDYLAVISLYGASFSTPYGWAAHHLKRKRPAFGHLEEEAGRASLRSHYKLASHNVHAGPNALFFQLGLIRPENVMLAGPSNAGLSEPAQNTAIDLARITSLLYWTVLDMDDMISMRALAFLRDEIVKAFARAEKKLERDDASLG